MENLASLQDVTNKSITHGQPPSDRRRRTHDDVQRKPRTNAATDSCRLFSCRALVSHHNEQIDVGILLGRARCMRPKQYDALWVELSGHLTDVLLDKTR